MAESENENTHESEQPKKKPVYGAAKPRYESPDQISGLIEQYFADCEGQLLLDENGEPRLTRAGEPIIIGRKQPTASGLALALGFRSRNSLLNYKAKKEFTATIEHAMLLLEAATEQRLYDRDGARGAMFSLQHNFRHWKEQQEEQKAPAVNIICDIPKEAVTVQETTPEQPEAPAEDGSTES